MITSALSVDLEEYYHGLDFEAAVPEAERPALPSRVELSTERVLDLLARHDTRATFFTVGQVAEAHPALIRKIDGAGHEVACHSYRHQLVSRQRPEEFREDVRRTKALLEDLAGKPVLGYRAPNYSIGPAEGWAFSILAEEGFRYDSSVYPILHDRYGDRSAPRFRHEIALPGRPDRLTEFPITSARVLGVNLPLAGGGYFRLYPYPLVRACLRRVIRGHRQPAMFYFHPWELDPEQPRPRMPFVARVRHYLNLHRMAGKLDRLLRDFRFAPAREVLGFSA